MKVYACFTCYYNGADQWRNLDRIFQAELDAMLWVDNFKGTEYEWREYQAEQVLAESDV